MKDLAIFSYKYTKHEKLLQDILSDKHLIYTTVLFFFYQNKTLCFVHFPMTGNSQADKKRDKYLRPAYLYDTNLRFHTIIIYWDPGLLHHPLLDGICDVGYHWEQIYRISHIKNQSTQLIGHTWEEKYRACQICCSTDTMLNINTNKCVAVKHVLAPNLHYVKGSFNVW